MKISYSWLKEYLNVNLSPEEVGDILTEIGLEVEGIEEVETVRGGLRGVVVGEVLTCTQHPNADRLHLTTVNIGSAEPLHIVCGAPNVAAGQKVVVALVGTTLYPSEGEPITLKKSKIRGELSEGMICAEDELGLGQSHDGILVLDPNAPIGQPAADYFGLGSDQVFEIGLTPNRTDAMSHYGVARDLRAALLHRGQSFNLQLPSVTAFAANATERVIPVEVKNTEACPRYLGITLTNIQVGPSPDWLQNRLRSIGLSPINNVVDVTNYVLHETGHPLHAFDADKIEGGKVVVQTTPVNTPFTTLDGKERKLHTDDLMICNAQGPMCIGGVFGGLHSGVSATTTAIFLESAYFNPVSVRKTAKRHGLNTDASFRYERGVDPSMTEYALKRACLLLQEVAGAQIASPIVRAEQEVATHHEVTISLNKLNQLIGQDIPKDQVIGILESLDIYVIKDQGDILDLHVAAYRVDVTRQADVVEEVLRIYGLNNIAFEPRLEFSITHQDKLNPEMLRNRAIDLMASGGFLEMMNNSLSKAEHAARFNPEAAEQQVNILNPLSQDLGVLRQSLLYGGLEAIGYNINRRRKDLSLFEFGKVYRRTENGFAENQHLAIFLTGNRQDHHWQSPARAASFYTLRGEVDRFVLSFGATLSYEPITHPDYQEALALVQGKKQLGILGKVHASWLKEMDIKQEVFVAELNWDALLPIFMRARTKFKELPRYPEVKRDLALLVDASTSFTDLRKAAEQSERKLLKEVDLFDVYEGDKIPAGKKSYAMSFVLASAEKTLTDQEVEKAMERILNGVRSTCGAELRQ